MIDVPIANELCQYIVVKASFPRNLSAVFPLLVLR